MPELPEVETVCRDLRGRLAGRFIKSMRIRRGDLREPVPAGLPRLVARRKVVDVRRRAKYILVRFAHGVMVIHLGMSGTVRADRAGAPPRKHDHIDWLVADSVLRYHDPRRFGRVYWTDDPASDPVLARAGIEPFARDFTGSWLRELGKGRRLPIKSLLMDSSRIAGIGNIYASESLFRAGVRPQRPAGRLAIAEADAIVAAARKVLREAIRAGGTSLRDHAYGEGKPGYFKQRLNVYDREHKPCRRCRKPIRRIVIGQRATFYCPACQK